MERHLDTLKGAKGAERGQLANKYEKQLKRAKNLLQTYEDTINYELEDPSV